MIGIITYIKNQINYYYSIRDTYNNFDASLLFDILLSFWI